VVFSFAVAVKVRVVVAAAIVESSFLEELEERDSFFEECDLLVVHQVHQ
jgi:hypothetical protein